MVGRLEKVIEGVTSAVSDSVTAVGVRLDDLDEKLGSEGCTTQDFDQSKTEFVGI